MSASRRATIAEVADLVCKVGSPQQRENHLAALARRHRADGVVVVSPRLSREQASRDGG